MKKHKTLKDQISKTYGLCQTRPIICNASLFRDFNDVITKSYPHWNNIKNSHLIKNDLNGNFLIDQPGHPFYQEITEQAGIANYKLFKGDKYLTKTIKFPYWILMMDKIKLTNYLEI